MIYSPKQYAELLDRTIAQIQELSRVKGGEYASRDDRLANFRKGAQALHLPTEVIWHVYAGKHWDAITTYVADMNAGVTRERSEPIEGRAHDMIVYLILFLAMCDERSGKSLDEKAGNAADQQRQHPLHQRDPAVDTLQL